MSGCTFCAKAKKLLSSSDAYNHYSYRELDIDLFAERYKAAAAATQWNTVPLIFLGSRFLGGFDALNNLHTKGELKQELEATAINADQAHDLPDYLRLVTDDEARAVEEDKAAHQQLVTLSDPPDVDIILPDGSTTMGYSQLERTLRKLVSPEDRGFLCWKNHAVFEGQRLVSKLLADAAPGNGQDDESTAMLLSACRGSSRDGIIAWVQKHLVQSTKLILSISKPGSEVFTANSDYFRLHSDTRLDPANLSLNCWRDYKASYADPAPFPHPCQLIASLRKRFKTSIAPFCTDEGVDYHAFALTAEYATFVNLTSALRHVDLSKLNDTEKLVFGINTYNLCILDAYCRRGPPTGLLDRYTFFNSVGYALGPHHYTLNDLENGFLRHNRKSVGALSVPFDKGDPRLALVVGKPDFRIHFALNCGAKSCPPIKMFTVENFEAEMDLATRAFLESSTQLDRPSKKLTVSKILDWYDVDFAPNTLQTILPFLSDQLQKDIRELGGPEKVRLSFAEYDWTTNARKQ